MSGDLGPRVAISAAQKFASLYADVDLLLFGNEQQLLELTSTKKLLKRRITIVHAPELVAMSDDPIHALRHKKDSSMWLALDAVRAGNADACVSAGNTGAVLAIAKYLVKTIGDIERPAICKSMPVEKGETFMLDLGANIHCAPEQLHQFALMGQVLAMRDANPHPRVSLLNIGRESSKGTELVRAAQELISADNRINYAGFIEPNCIFSGTTDVIVCDGFTGNIALKSSEGAAQFIARKIRNLLTKNILSRLLALPLWPLLKKLRKDMNPDMYNGASFLGLRKTVVKSHGNANKKAFLQALKLAREQVIQKVPERIEAQIVQKIAT